VDKKVAAIDDVQLVEVLSAICIDLTVLQLGHVCLIPKVWTYRTHGGL
jgi:hypothetical protein